MSSRMNYWSCGKFAAWVRDLFGLPVKKSGTCKEWSDFEKASKATHPYVHWFTDDGLCLLQDIIYWPYDKWHDIGYYFYNRFITETHHLKTTLKPGKYYDLDTRIMESLFTELVEFVEVELSWFHCACDKAARVKYKMPWWRRHWFIWRCPESGLEYLDWAASLKMDEEYGVYKDSPDYGKLTEQAENAIAQKALYLWWKTIRPARPDPYEVSGWDAYWSNKKGDLFEKLNHEDETEEEVAQSKTSLDMLRNLEEEFKNEDTEMMIKLIKIRGSLWT